MTVVNDMSTVVVKTANERPLLVMENSVDCHCLPPWQQFLLHAELMRELQNTELVFGLC